MEARLKYVIGDATIPNPDSMRYVLQICNDEGKYGAGISGAIAKRWPKVEEAYRSWYRSQNNFKLGEIQVIRVQSDVAVINMIAQQGTVSKTNKVPIKYDALESCLEKVLKEIKIENGSIHCGKIGSQLARGKWSKIEELIQKHFIKNGINVTIYELAEEKNKL